MTFYFPDFKPRFPWWGGDLQTLRDGVLRWFFLLSDDVGAKHSESVEFPLADGTGDIMLGTLDTPFNPRPGLPLVLLIHGAPGDENSPSMISMSRHMLEDGYRVLRLNQRGAGRSRTRCTGQYSAGLSRDLELLFDVMRPDLMADGIVAVGYSVGGAVLLKYLGEAGRAGNRTPLLAAASVSAPIDLRSTCLELMRWRNRSYQRRLLSKMREEALAPAATLTAEEVEGIRAARTIWEYDEHFTAPRSGQPSIDAYYDNCSAIDYLADIRIPTLCVAALDDPWVPSGSYLGYYWAGNKFLTPLLPESGGHVGFHGKGDYDVQLWRDLVVAEFFRKAPLRRSEEPAVSNRSRLVAAGLR
jgi:predicted alpha/beta-fold hydrolase